MGNNPAGPIVTVLTSPRSPPTVQFFPVEKEVEGAGIAGLDDYLLAAMKGALAAGLQDFRRRWTCHRRWWRPSSDRARESRDGEFAGKRELVEDSVGGGETWLPGDGVLFGWRDAVDARAEFMAR